MATVKAVLRKKKNPEGLYPITIKITKDRKSSYLEIGQYIHEFLERKKSMRKEITPNAIDIKTELGHIDKFKCFAGKEELQFMM